MWVQREIGLARRPRGCHPVTRVVRERLPELAALDVGMLHRLLRRTSASPTRNERGRGRLAHGTWQGIYLCEHGKRRRQTQSSRDAARRVTAGIVLAGGRSARMGSPKATLEWHGSTLVRRVGGILARTLDGPVIVVRSVGQELPRLPRGWQVVDDARPQRGPLEGLAAGLAALGDQADVAFVSSTDAPLLHPALIAAVRTSLRPHDEICVPVLEGRPQPLAAAYRASVAARVCGLLAAGELRLGALLERSATRRVELDGTPVNLNDPAAYAAARARPAPQVTVRRPDAASATVAAATLGAAAAAVGVVLGADVAAAIDGRAVEPDAEVPLVAGDEVVFTRTA